MLLLVQTEVWQEGSRLKMGRDRPGWSVGWTGGGRSLFCVQFFWLRGRDPAHRSVGSGAGRGGPYSEGAGSGLEPRAQEQGLPWGRNKGGRDETVSVFRAAGVCLCVCRLIEFYLRLDFAEGSPQMQSLC